MNLFELKGSRVVFAPQALVIKEFKAIWDKDKTKNKEKAVRELAYIYYMQDFRSDLADIVDRETRDEQARKMLEIPDKWKPDEKTEEAMERYDMLQDSLALQSMRAAYVGASKLNDFFYDVDLNMEDKGGKKVYKPSDIDNALKNVRSRVKELREVEEEVKKAIEAKIDNQGSIQAAPFEKSGL